MSYNTQKTFAMASQRRCLTLRANGGSILIEVEHAEGVWLQAGTFDANGVYEIYFGAATIRITPQGGADYMLH